MVGVNCTLPFLCPLSYVAMVIFRRGCLLHGGVGDHHQNKSEPSLFRFRLNEFKVNKCCTKDFFGQNLCICSLSTWIKSVVWSLFSPIIKR